MRELPGGSRDRGRRDRRPGDPRARWRSDAAAAPADGKRDRPKGARRGGAAGSGRGGPAGSNRTPFGAWFGLDGVPWCNIFVSYCFAVGARTTIAAGFHAAGCTPRGCAYVPVDRGLAPRDRACGSAASARSPGDLAIYNWDGGAPTTSGSSSAPAAAASFTAIEGNTAVGDDSNGGEVMRRERTPRRRRRLRPGRYTLSRTQAPNRAFLGRPTIRDGDERGARRAQRSTCHALVEHSARFRGRRHGDGWRGVARRGGARLRAGRRRRRPRRARPRPRPSRATRSTRATRRSSRR